MELRRTCFGRKPYTAPRSQPHPAPIALIPPRLLGRLDFGFGRLAWSALSWARLSQLTSPEPGMSEEQQQQPTWQAAEGLRPSNVAHLVTNQAQAR